MFSDKIKKLRKLKGLTQEQLADALGISRSTVAMYEAGEREPNFEMCETIADFFNCRLSDLLESATERTDAVEIMQDELFEKRKILFSLTNSVKEEDIDTVTEILKKFVGTD